MVKPKEEEKFKKILAAAVEVIAEYGYHQCTVAEIANLAGVAAGTVYLYFKNKDDILIRVFQEYMGEFIVSLRNKLVHCSTTGDRLKTIVFTHFFQMEQNPSFALVTQTELRQSDQLLNQAITEPLLGYFKLIEEVISEGINRQEIDVADVRVAREMIFGALDAATTGWVWARKKRTLVSKTDKMVNLFEGALRLKVPLKRTN